MEEFVISDSELGLVSKELIYNTSKLQIPNSEKKLFHKPVDHQAQFIFKILTINNKIKETMLQQKF